VAHKQQQSNGVLCTVFADGWACNNGIHHTIAKQQLHCNRGMAFSAWSVPRHYKQDHLAVVVSCVEAGLNTSTIALRVIGGDEKGAQCLGVQLGHPASVGYKYGDLALQVMGGSNLRQ
jgi:hypothetical protein